MSENIKLNAWEAAEEIVKLRRENAALRAQDAYLVSTVDQLERENAALREALVNADELERYSGSNGERQWGKCSAWLHPDDAVVIISAKAIDSARKEAQPNRTDHSGGINEMIQKGKEAQP